ncbi:MAG: xanthine dehydrogenase accessory protein XdhC [Phreatobacter sp.]
MEVWPRVEAMLEGEGACVLVSIVAARGSVPRESGARMIVRPDGGFLGTIGGGALEWQALARAQALFDAASAALLVQQALGPDLGQCCGGHVTVLIERFTTADRQAIRELSQRERTGPFRTLTELRDGRAFRRILADDEVPPPAMRARFVECFGDRRKALALFGAGHVGRALVLALAPLPFDVTWWDGREGAFPAAIPGNATPRTGSWQDALASVPAEGQVLVMTHSHALDLDIVAAALADSRNLDVGVIGSASKRARFVHRLRDLGLAEARIAALRCPIGIAGIGGKEPAVIAAAIAAECLLLAGQRAKTANLHRFVPRSA